jgi:hypothetical protein
LTRHGVKKALLEMRGYVGQLIKPLIHLVHRRSVQRISLCLCSTYAVRGTGWRMHLEGPPTLTGG